MGDHSYEYRASWSDEDGAWLGMCDGFLLVSHLAETEAEALSGIRSLVADLVADLRADGEPLPCPIPWELRRAALDSATTLVPPTAARTPS